MRMPALAVVGADHRVIRSTETFRLRCDNAAALCDRAPELDLVLTGKTDTAVIDVGELHVAIEAVTDEAGKRQAMLSLPGDDLASDPEASLAALREAAEESPALVWVKDIEGRYLYVNPRFQQYLETSEERICGNTDDELPAVETVDGPRLRYTEDGLTEPLALEYTVPEYESRPAMAAFRFPLRNEAGDPIATCGVAAPSNEAEVAQDEAVRLMQLERWNRLDPRDVRAELLEQWHVQATPGPPTTDVDEPPAESAAAEVRLQTSLEEPPAPSPPAEPAPPAEPSSSAEPASPADEVSYRREEEWVRQLRQSARISTSEAISETADALQCDLQLARKWAERADQLQGELQEAHARVRDAEAELQQAQASLRDAEAGARQASAAAGLAAEEAKRHETELEQSRLESRRYQAQLELLSEELDQAKADGETARSELEAARREIEMTRRELGAARAQSESLRGPSDAALRLSEELGRALSAERERGDELARILARLRSRLGDFEGALDRTKGGKRESAGAGSGQRQAG